MSKYPAITAGQRLDAALLRDMLTEVVWKTTNTERSSTSTVAVDPDLQFEGAAGAVYLVEFAVMPGATTTADFKTAWEVPSGAAGLRTVLGPGTSASDSSADNIAVRLGIHQFATEVTYSGVRNSNSLAFGVKEWAVITLSTGGTVGLSWAQGTSNGTATILYGGSWMRAERLQ